MPDPNNLPSCACMPGVAPGIGAKLDMIYCAIQGAGSGLPDQAGHAGEFLTTDGTEAEWVPLAGGGDVVAGGALTLNSLIIGQGGTTIAAATTGAGILTFLGTPSSANLAAAVTGETGSGALVFGTAPTFASNITVGTPAGTTGAILLRGTTSGTVTLTTAAAAGTWTLQLPANDGGSGQVLTTDGNGITTWETPAGGASLTATFVGYGSAGNALTGEAPFNYIAATNTLAVPLLELSAGAGELALTVALAGSAGGVSVTEGNGSTALMFNSNTGTTFAGSHILCTENGGDVFQVGAGGTVTAPLANITTVNVTTVLRPATDGGAALGDTTHGWSGVFLDTLATINIDNGNWVATHTSGILTVGTGDLRVTTAGANSASVVTVGGAQTLTSKTLTAPVINASTQTGNQNIAAVPANDHSANGPTTSIFNLGATIAIMDLVYLGSSSKWLLTDADAAATATGMLGICLDGGVDTDTTTVALPGAFVRDDTWNWTPGATLYIDTATPGQIVASQPSGTDDVIRVVGFAVTADVIYFNPSPDFITHT